MNGTTNNPYVRHEPSSADNATEYVGGNIARFTAGAALLTGDVVYISAANTVNKSSTAAAYLAFAGVVVGGQDTFGDCVSNDNDVGITAASASGKWVYVQLTGVAWVVAAAALVAGAPLEVATTAGRVDDVATPTSGEVVGISITAASNAGDKVLMLIQHR